MNSKQNKLYEKKKKGTVGLPKQTQCHFQNVCRLYIYIYVYNIYPFSLFLFLLLLFAVPSFVRGRRGKTGVGGRWKQIVLQTRRAALCPNLLSVQQTIILAHSRTFKIPFLHVGRSLCYIYLDWSCTHSSPPFWLLYFVYKQALKKPHLFCLNKVFRSLITVVASHLLPVRIIIIILCWCVCCVVLCCVVLCSVV